MIVRSNTHKLEEESLIEVRKIIHAMNCEFRTVEPDRAGIDLEIGIIHNNKQTGKFFKSQVKAGQSYISSETDEYVKVKIEKKYIDLWINMDVPVILFFYHPDESIIYWKVIQHFFKAEPNYLKKLTKTVLIPFYKDFDELTPGTFDSFMSIVKGDFEYNKITMLENKKELVLSNFFKLNSLPTKIFVASTELRKKRDLTNLLTNYYTFILKDKNLYTFSNLADERCELKNYCNLESFDTLNTRELQETYLTELLNTFIMVFALKKGLVVYDNKFFFPANVLRQIEDTEFYYKPLRRKNIESSKKVYIKKVGKTLEYKHMAVNLVINKISESWYLEISPDWYFTYPKNPEITKKDIGIRITREKASTYNNRYLYLFHAWKQFLSDGNKELKIHCDDLNDSQFVLIDMESNEYSADFYLFNDYFGPQL